MIDHRTTIVALGALTAACGSGEGSIVSHDDFAGGTASTAHACSLLGGYVGSADAADRGVQAYSFALLNEEKQILLHCAGGDQSFGAPQPFISVRSPPSAAAVMTHTDSNQLLLDLPVARHLLNGGVNWPLDEMLVTMRTLLPSTSSPAHRRPFDAQPPCPGKLTAVELRECVAQNAAAPQVAGARPAFRDLAAGYRVVGHIASQVSDQSWEEFFAARSGVPPGIDARSHGELIEVNGPRATSGAVNEVAGYVRVLRLLMSEGEAHGATVLSSRSDDMLQTNQIVGRIVRYSPADRSLYPGYTFGLFVSDEALRPGGASPEFSAPDLFGTAPWISDEMEYGAVLLIDKNQSSGAAMWKAVRPLLIIGLNEL